MRHKMPEDLKRLRQCSQSVLGGCGIVTQRLGARSERPPSRLLLMLPSIFDRLKQEYITPYTPEQNGLIERFFRSLKEECV